MTEDLELYRRANLFLQVSLVLGVFIFIAGAMDFIKFDYAFYASVICVAIGAAIRQLIVARNS